jgi:hypothetical protein
LGACGEVGGDEFSGCAGIEQVLPEPVFVSAADPEPVFRVRITDPKGRGLEGEQVLIHVILENGEKHSVSQDYTDADGWSTYNWYEESPAGFLLFADEVESWVARTNDGVDQSPNDESAPINLCPKELAVPFERADGLVYSRCPLVFDTHECS